MFILFLINSEQSWPENEPKKTTYIDGTTTDDNNNGKMRHNSDVICMVHPTIPTKHVVYSSIAFLPSTIEREQTSKRNDSGVWTPRESRLGAANGLYWEPDTVTFSQQQYTTNKDDHIVTTRVFMI